MSIVECLLNVYLIFYFHSHSLFFFNPIGIFYEIPECANECVFVSCAFSWASPLLFVLSYSDMLVLSYDHIVYYYNLLKACLLSNVRQKGGRFSWERRWGGTGRREGRETEYSLYCISNEYMFNKGMKQKK